MKDIILLSEIKLFSLRPDEVGFETLISTIERLLEMALSRINEQKGGEDYRRGLLMTAVSVVEPEAPAVVDLRVDMAYPSRSKAQLKIDPPKAPPPPPPPPPRSVKGEPER